jgi:hypothetical protein
MGARGWTWDDGLFKFSLQLEYTDIYAEDYLIVNLWFKYTFVMVSRYVCKVLGLFGQV